ncbi:hypothetical protein J0H58_11075 [bacterium]|nr:hypothetical protein [bacterium]
MTDPDDDWGDLARELGVQKPSTPPDEQPEPVAAHHAADPEAAEGDQEEFAEGLVDEAAAAEDADAEGEGDAGDAEGGEDAPGEGQPGTGRKRRRRRRRRKKGGAEGEAADATGIADEPAPSYQAAARTPAPARAPAPVAAAADEADVEPGEDDDEVGGAVSPAEEDTAGEVLRELIATWNVPSWDEIITGLHRP